MLVSENRRRSNPRVLYGILAESVLEQFEEHSRDAENRHAYFQNVLRLLEMYRYDTLRRTTPRAVLDRRQSDLRALKRDRADNEAVERALTASHQANYQDLTKAELLEHFKVLFGRLSRGEAVDDNDLTRARAFLETFAKALLSQ